ncbi:MAG: DNA-directed RNA polymerase subunit beta, partial [Candidatus Sungbacteria bacterium]|nr:DNA-directed RNA polymerase subunit beta [Candidatus Sungbacteria bacterium]
MQTIPKKYFSKYRKPFIELPLLSEVQLNSYNWFFKKGLRELFNEISPLHDYTNKELSLEFLDYYLDELKYIEADAKDHNLSFEAALRVRAKLTNKRTGEIKEQEIYLGDFPL